MIRLVKQRFAFSHDPIGPGTDQTRTSCLDRFGPLSGLAHDKHRFSERWRLLLDTPRIGQDKEATLHQPHKGEVVHRLDQLDPVPIAERLEDWRPNIGIEMDRLHDLDILALAKFGQGATNLPKSFAKTLPSMTSDQDQAPVVAKPIEPAAQVILNCR